MGHEQVLDGWLRSSIELRQIRNAKLTALRHMKWQKMQFQREEEEKHKAKEILERRRKERARLATYIYSSSRFHVNEPHNRIQGQVGISKARVADLRKKRAHLDIHTKVPDFSETNSQTKVTSQRDCLEGHLPAALSNDNGLSHINTKELCHAGIQGTSKIPAGFIESVLQERLQNETATSLLIAEITDLKSRLEDCKKKPKKTEVVSDLNAPLNKTEELNRLNNASQTLCTSNKRLQTTETEDRTGSSCAKAPDAKESIDNCFCSSPLKQNESVEDNRQQTLEILESNQAHIEGDDGDSSKLQERFGDIQVACKVGNTKCSETNGQNAVCSQGRNTHKQALAWEIVWRAQPKGYLFQKQSWMQSTNNESMDLHALTAKPANMPDGALFEDRMLNQTSFQKATHEQGDQIFQDDIPVLHNKELDMKPHPSKVPLGSNEGCKSSYEPFRRKDNFVDSSSYRLKPLCTQAASDQFHQQTCHCSKQHHKSSLSSCCRERMGIWLLRNKTKGHSKLLGLSDEEKSLLASIERLDVKLATVFAKNPESSRMSSISEGHLSTKSAPPIIKKNLGCNLLSVNVNMFPLRPLTSQSKNLSIASRRRQIVGRTNISKEREIQICNLQGAGGKTVHQPVYQGDVKDGTIFIHQNAEFLFS